MTKRKNRKCFTKVLSLFMVMATLILITSSVWADVNPTGLVAHWKFDEGFGITAHDSAGSNNGTIYGADWTTDNIGAGSLYFDGINNDIVVVPDSPDWTFGTENFTITFWMNPLTNSESIFFSVPYPTIL